MTAPLTVLQITDTHLKAPVSAPEPPPTLLGVDTSATLAAVLEYALAERTPDAVIASGDLAHEPVPAAYRHFRELLEAHYRGPVLHLPGNHDCSEPMARVLGNHSELPLGAWELIGFDTHVDDQTEAAFGEAERATLEQRIRASQAEHVLLVCHHHLLPVGCPWLDKDRVPGGRELLEDWSVRDRGHGSATPRGIVFGHVHQQVSTAVNGLPVLGTPSTCFQFEPHSARFAIDRSADTGRPGYRWLELYDDGTITSWVCRHDDYVLNIDLSDRS